MIHPEVEIAALLLPETIPQWQFHSHVGSTRLLRPNTTLAEKQRWRLAVTAVSRFAIETERQHVVEILSEGGYISPVNAVRCGDMQHLLADTISAAVVSTVTPLGKQAGGVHPETGKLWVRSPAGSYQDCRDGPIASLLGTQYSRLKRGVGSHTDSWLPHCGCPPFPQGIFGEMQRTNVFSSGMRELPELHFFNFPSTSGASSHPGPQITLKLLL